MGLRRDIAVYFGLADETEEARQAHRAALRQTSPARMVLSAIPGALVTGTLIGVIVSLLEGGTLTVTRILENGWLVAIAVSAAGAVRELWERRQVMRGRD